MPRPRDADHASDWLYERAEEASAIGLPLDAALQAVRDGYSSVAADQMIAEWDSEDDTAPTPPVVTGPPPALRVEWDRREPQPGEPQWFAVIVEKDGNVVLGELPVSVDARAVIVGGVEYAVPGR